MAISKTARLGLTRWTEDTDAWNRDDFDDDNAALEALAAIGRSGTFANRGSAATYSRSTYWATDHQALYVSTGAVWRRVELSNINAYPMLSSIPRGGATVDDLAPAACYLGDQTAVMHTIYLPGGTNIASIAIARGNQGDVTVNRLWFAIYDGLTGAKLATTADAPGTIFANSTRSAAFAGAGFTAPAPGHYTILCYAGSSGQFSPVGALTNSAISKTSSTVLTANLAPTGAPADLSFGVVPKAAVPWLGLNLGA